MRIRLKLNKRFTKRRLQSRFDKMTRRASRKHVGGRQPLVAGFLGWWRSQCSPPKRSRDWNTRTVRTGTNQLVRMGYANKTDRHDRQKALSIPNL